MKSPLVILSLLLFLIACHSAGDKKAAVNIDRYSELWHAILIEGKLELFNSDHFSEDVVMYAEPENIIGLQAMRDYYTNFFTGFPGFEFRIKDIFGSGDKLVKHWYFKGTHTGEFFGISASGKEVELEGSTIVEMRDGKIISERNFIDNMALFSQLGVVSDPNNLYVVNLLYNSLSAGDVPTAISTMTTDVKWNQPESHSYDDADLKLNSNALLKEVFRHPGNEWEVWELVNIELLEMSHNKVLAILHYHRLQYMKNGKPIHVKVAHLFSLSDGKINGFQKFMDQ